MILVIRRGGQTQNRINIGYLENVNLFTTKNFSRDSHVFRDHTGYIFNY